MIINFTNKTEFTVVYDFLSEWTEIDINCDYDTESEIFTINIKTQDNDDISNYLSFRIGVEVGKVLSVHKIQNLSL